MFENLVAGGLFTLILVVTILVILLLASRAMVKSKAAVKPTSVGEIQYLTLVVAFLRPGKVHSTSFNSATVLAFIGVTNCADATVKDSAVNKTK
jgi:hypothetical protein